MGIGKRTTHLEESINSNRNKKLPYGVIKKIEYYHEIYSDLYDSFSRANRFGMNYREFRDSVYGQRWIERNKINLSVSFMEKIGGTLAALELIITDPVLSYKILTNSK